VLSKERVLAKTDGLTGLLNKTNVYRRLRDLISEDASAEPVSVFLLDIDHFKLYNDTNGHLPGDELLKRMGALLRENSRENEVVGRYGGEEFLILMPGTPKDVGMRVAERIRALIEGTDFEHTAGQPGGRVTISGGVATWPKDGEDVDLLLRHADEALYEAKRGGRNRVMAHLMTDLGPAGEAGHWAAGYEDGGEVEREKPER
jgi:diguanylate cyclase (GGDEF)-like protein